MSDTTVDKIIDNKFLLLTQRIFTPILTILLPIAIGYFIGLGDRIGKLEFATATSDARSIYVTEQRNEDFNEVKDAIADLRGQNVAVLQAIARLETAINK